MQEVGVAAQQLTIWAPQLALTCHVCLKMLLAVHVRLALHTKLKSVLTSPAGAAVLCFADGDSKGLAKSRPHSKRQPGQAEVEVIITGIVLAAGTQFVTAVLQTGVCRGSPSDTDLWACGFFCEFGEFLCQNVLPD